jgi:F-type H+-transporting ATPase subunit a
MKIDIFSEKIIQPFQSLGLSSKFWDIHIKTLQDTWIAMFILFSLVLIAGLFLKKDLNPIALVFEKAVSFFDDLCKESFGKKFKIEYFTFVSSLFFFTLFCCLVGLLPYVEEPAKDLNTAFALGTLSFVYVQVQKIRIHGVLAYFKEFFEPFFILLPLNIIGEFAKVASMSFRLFGNILGGSIIFLIAVNALSVYKTYFMIFALVFLTFYWLITKFVNVKKYKVCNVLLNTGLVFVFFLAGAQMFFGIFEGFVQSFVLTMLTITYLAVGVQDESDIQEGGG